MISFQQFSNLVASDIITRNYFKGYYNSFFDINFELTLDLNSDFNIYLIMNSIENSIFVLVISSSHSYLIDSFHMLSKEPSYSLIEQVLNQWAPEYQVIPNNAIIPASTDTKKHKMLNDSYLTSIYFIHMICMKKLSHIHKFSHSDLHKNKIFLQNYFSSHYNGVQFK